MGLSGCDPSIHLFGGRNFLNILLSFQPTLCYSGLFSRKFWNKLWRPRALGRLGIACFFHIMIFHFSYPVLCFHCSSGASPQWRTANYTFFSSFLVSGGHLVCVTVWYHQIEGIPGCFKWEGWQKLSWVSWTREWILSKQRIVAETQTRTLKLWLTFWQHASLCQITSFLLECDCWSPSQSRLLLLLFFTQPRSRSWQSSGWLSLEWYGPD